jgi:hypothetical protein
MELNRLQVNLQNPKCNHQEGSHTNFLIALSFNIADDASRCVSYDIVYAL